MSFYLHIAFILLSILTTILIYYSNHLISYYNYTLIQDSYKNILILKQSDDLLTYNKLLITPNYLTNLKLNCSILSSCNLNRSSFTSIPKLFKITSQDYKYHIFNGIPFIVSDAGNNWKISNMSLKDLADIYPNSPVIPRSRVRDKKIHGLLPWEKFAATSLSDLVTSNNNSSFYFSLLHVGSTSSFYHMGLYDMPYFLSNEEFIAEWLYIGKKGTGVLPHIDHMCMGKWSFQLTGKKVWTLGPSLSSINHWKDMEVIVNEGELLMFSPDHEHGTICLSDECVSLHGYFQLPFEDNCYLQNMMNIGYKKYKTSISEETKQSFKDDGFVQYKNKKNYDAPMDYLFKCPPTYYQQIKTCSEM